MYLGTASEDPSQGLGPPASSRNRQATPAITKGRLDTLRTLVARCFSRRQSAAIPRLELLDMVNAELAPGEPKFEEPELDQGLAKLEEANKVMIDDTGDEVIYVG
ncbi:unnamed protein product [Effrenium voratum]|uniref:MCM3-like winged helix domain-containing protein n=1 Tax=Effrenium voratum TaxID=2562239 RepID=A0AA36J9L8_9DINO|nr:unnamed protein product [Effrenium voratum]CAJ1415056.1 unnamed protein product [Effrenium voratum]